MMKTLVLFFIMITSFSWSQQLDNYHIPIRAMGMGGVHSLFPRNTDMPTSNAAFLRYVQTLDFELLTLGVGGPGLSKVTEFQDLPEPDTIGDLNDYFGRPAWVLGDARVAVVSPYFGISGHKTMSLLAQLNNPFMPEFDVRYLDDYGYTIAFSIPVDAENAFGLGFKKINRAGGARVFDFDTIEEYIDTNDTDVIMDELENRGVGYGFDLSYLHRNPNGVGPLFTFVWKDLGYTSFQKTAGDQTPPSIRDNLTMGVGYEWDSALMGTRLGLEYRHIRTTGIQLGKKIHMGAEFSFPLIDVRVGLNQGYMTYGMGFDLSMFRFEVAQYTEELGVYPGQNPDARLQIGVTLQLSVDPDFKWASGSSSSGSNGQRRKLKQRR